MYIFYFNFSISTDLKKIKQFVTYSLKYKCDVNKLMY